MESFQTSPTPSSMPPSVSVTPSLHSLAQPFADHLENTQYWASIGPLDTSEVTEAPQLTSPQYLSGSTAKYYRPRSAVLSRHATPECVSLLKRITPGSVASSVTPELSVSGSETPYFQDYEYYDLRAHLGNPPTFDPQPSFPQQGRKDKNTVRSFALPRAPQAGGHGRDPGQDYRGKWSELMMRARAALKCKAGTQISEQAIQHMFERLVSFAETAQARKNLPSVIASKPIAKPKQRGSVLRSVPMGNQGDDQEEELDSAMHGIRGSDKEDYRRVLLEELEAYTDVALSAHIDAMANDIDENGIFSVQSRQNALLSTFQDGFKCGFIWGVRFYSPDSDLDASADEYSTRWQSDNTGASAPQADKSDEAAFRDLLAKTRGSKLQSVISQLAADLPTYPSTLNEFMTLTQAATKGQKQATMLRKLLAVVTDKIFFFKHLIVMTRTALPSQVDLLEEDDPTLAVRKPTLTDAFLEQLPEVIQKEGNRIAYSLKEACRLKEFRETIAKALSYPRVDQLSQFHDLEDVRDAHVELLNLFRGLQRGTTTQHHDADALLPLRPYVDELQRRAVKAHIGLDPTGKDELIKVADTFLYSIGPERFKLVQMGADMATRHHPELLLRLTKDEAYSAFAVFVFVVNYCCKMFSCPSIIGLLPTVSKVHVQLSSLQNLAAALRKTLGFTHDASHNRIIERVNAIALHTAERVGVFSPTEAGEIMAALGVTNVADVIPAINLLKAKE